MTAVTSQMLELGTEAVNFSLPDADGQLHTLPADASAYLVMFICNHCPFVKHIREELAQLGHDYLPQGVAIFAIRSGSCEIVQGGVHPGFLSVRCREEAGLPRSVG